MVIDVCSKSRSLVVVSAASRGSQYARLAVVSVNAVAPVLLLGVDVEEKLVDGAAGVQTLFAVIAVRNAGKENGTVHLCR